MNGLLLNVLILFLSSIFIESEAYSQCSTLTPSAPSGLTLAVTSPVSSTPTSPSNGTDSSLVGYWKFDEGTGSTACDSSGKGNNGTLINGPLRAIGKIGGGLYFDGIDDNVTVADSNSLDITSSFTLSAWVNPASTSTDFRSILVKNYKYYLYASAAGYCGTGNPLAGFDEQTTNAVCQPAPLPANTWTHLAATHTGSILTLYRNGVAVATSNISKTLSPSTGTLQIGASQFGENFKGLIDEVRVHNRALNITEVQALFQQDSAVGESGLVAHWKFDEGNGTTASDSSGSGNAGTLTNGPLWTDGRIGKGLYFDGIDDHVRVTDSNSLDLSSSFTLSAWVNPASTSTDFRSILVKNYKYYLYASVAGYCGTGNPLAGFDEQTTNAVCHPAPLPANTWTHLAATHTGSILTLYRNGVAVATSNISKTLSPSTGTLQIGASQFGENFKGLIDEVRVHNRALNITEIQAMFQQESGDLAPSSPPVATAPATGSLFSFSLANSGDKSVLAGSSVTNSITASLVSASSQAISFSVSGLPAGANGSFSSASCSPACSTVLTINTTGSTPAGSFPILVSSTGGGVTKTTAFTLSVTLALTVATPTITPDGGTFSDSISVAMQTTTTGASIYYTTDGSIPTQSSTPYTGVMTLNASATFNAKAYKTGLSSSAAVSASFVKNSTGKTYYVATNGSDSNSGSITSPFRTIAKGLAALTPGDTLYLRAGTYGHIDTNLTKIPSGTSFTSAVTISAYPREPVTLTANSDGAALNLTDATTAGLKYVIFRDLTLTTSISLFGSIDHIKFENVTVIGDASNNCVRLNDPRTHHIWFTGGRYHGCGHYGFYIEGNDNIVENLRIENTGSRRDGLAWAIHNYSGVSRPSRNIYRNLYVRNTDGILLWSGDANLAYNNIVSDSLSAGFSVAGDATNTKIYNNTIYNGSSVGIEIFHATGIIVRNNIIYRNALGTIINDGTGTTMSNNLTSDPRFVDYTAEDFRLQSGSPAIDGGMDLSSEGITFDYTRTSNRPQGPAYDVGAYEYIQ